MNNELSTLSIFLILGICIGLLFDIFRISRRVFKTPNIIIYIEDISFWILTGFLILYTIGVFTNGEIRLYMILMIFIGAFLYFISISKYFILLNTKILNFIKSTINFLLIPLRKTLNIVRKTLNITGRKIFQKKFTLFSKK